MDETVKEQVAALRSQGLPPKAIARRLGLRPAEINELIRQHAAQLASHADPEALPPLKACWLSPGWSTGLGLLGEAEEWRAYDPEAGSSEGMVSALWARVHRFDKLAVCGCLVDTYCLGVKNAVGPKIMTDGEFRSFGQRYFGSYDAPPVEVPMHVVQSLVLGAVEYADALGLSPHPDFAAVRPTLGQWNGPSPIRFGKDGKPFYIQGPDDDVYRIMQTLRSRLGDGRFDFALPAG